MNRVPMVASLVLYFNHKQFNPDFYRRFKVTFEKQASVMAKCWAHMFKTGIITKFLMVRFPQKKFSLLEITSEQEGILIRTLKENFLKYIETHPDNFTFRNHGTFWDVLSDDVLSGLKAANINMKHLNALQFQLRPFIYMNSGGDVSINNGGGCKFIYYNNEDSNIKFFGKNYIAELDRIYDDFFKNYKLAPLVGTMVTSSNATHLTSETLTSIPDGISIEEDSISEIRYV